MAQPSESGHWYQKDGTPRYTIIGTNGKERPTTLRDARKLDLVPSVTTILSLAYKPGLENWKQEQTILSCLTMPRIEGESEQDYIQRLKADAKEQAIKAAERGTQIHAWIQQGFEGKEKVPLEGSDYFISASCTLTIDCGYQDWITEEPFASHFDRMYYGGKVDLHSDEYLIDIKTTDKPVADLKTWDEHHMQLAAYMWGIDGKWLQRKSGILYVNSITAESRLIWVDTSDIHRGHDCFKALLKYWYAKNKMNGRG